MSIDNLKSMIPDYAKDIKLNLSSLANDETLSVQQLWGTMLASALASGQAEVMQQMAAAASENLDENALNAVKAAASIMAMNNMYYRFVHITNMSEFKTMPAKLRMNVIANPGVDKADFELWSLAVSVVNGCGMCIDAHAKTLLDHGVTKEQVQTASRIASVVHAVARVIEGEKALSGVSEFDASKAA
jgi:alkyl hydroperoxide reductase subunit D